MAKQDVVNSQSVPVESDSAMQQHVMRIAVKVSRRILRRWWMYVAVGAVSVVGAVYLSGLFSVATHRFTTSVVYCPLPVDDSARQLYVAPDLKTMTSFITLPNVLNTAIENTQVDATAATLAKQLSVVEPRGTNRIELTLATGAPAEGAGLLSEICFAFQESIAQLRRQVVERTLVDLRQAISRNQELVDGCQKKLMEFSGSLQISDLKHEQEQLKTDIASMDFKLTSSRIEEQGLRVQHKIVQDQLDNQKKEEELQAKKEKEAEAAEESLADNRRRQDRLNELIREERRLNEIRAKLDARKNEFDRKLKLFQKGYISRSDFEVIESQVKSLESQIMEGRKIDEWKVELDRIDKMVVPKAKSRRLGSPIIHQTMFKLVELDLHINNAREVQRQTELKLSQQRLRQQELRRFTQQQNGMTLQLEAAHKERRTLTSQLSALTSIRDMGPVEFAVIAPPADDMQPVTSNRKKLFAVMLVGLVLVMASPLLTFDVWRSIPPTVDEYFHQLQIPLLTPDAAKNQVDVERHLALRIQQLIPEQGSVVAFLPETYESGDRAFLRIIADVLARREENVLLVWLDANHANDDSRDILTDVSESFGHQIPTLCDYLVNDQLAFDRLVTSAQAEVHCVHGGDFDLEMLYSQRMQAFVAEARRRYSIVMVLGMPLANTTDCEMLTSHCDGVVALHNKSQLLSSESKRTLDSLVEVRAPLFGAAVRLGIAPKVSDASSRRPGRSFVVQTGNRAVNESSFNSGLSAADECQAKEPVI